MHRFLRLFCIILMTLVTIAVTAQNITSSRVRLKKNSINGRSILTTEMLSKDFTTYIIRYSYDLEGNTLIMPKGCNLVFKKNGSISNGEIVFSDTWLKGEKFNNLHSASGTLLNNSFDAARYGFVNDTDQLRFLLSQAKDGYALKLESKIYRINSLKGVSYVRYDSAFAPLVGLKDISIIGKNTVIVDSASKSLIGNGLYSLLQFDACKDVTIEGITYKWTEQATLHPKVEGIVFLRTFNECCAFDINVSVENAGRGIYSGRWNEQGDPGRGICDSKLSVVADHVGYPIAIEKGDGLDIRNNFAYAHRGTYLVGVTNSNVYVEGKEAYSTKVNLLLTDASDKNGCYFCDEITATVIDTGSNEMSSSVIMAQCNTYPQSYEQFKKRKPYKVNNIDILVRTPEKSSTSFEGFLFSDLAQIGDIMNIAVFGTMMDSGKNSRLTRLNAVPKGRVTFQSVQSPCNYIIINSEIPDDCTIIFDNCPNIAVSIPSQKRKTTGKIVFNDCSFLWNTVRDKAKTGIYPVIKWNGRD